jgi:putative membrane protein
MAGVRFMTTVIYGGLLVLGLALLGVTMVRVLVGGLLGASDRRAGQPEPGTGARRMLDERYAAGDLTTEEYQHRLRVLADEAT